MHTTFHKPARAAQSAPGVIPSVRYIINTWKHVLRTSWGILSGSSLLRTFICCRASPVSYQISLSNHRKIPHLIKLLSNQSEQGPMSWLSENNVCYHINMKIQLTLCSLGRTLGLETQHTWDRDIECHRLIHPFTVSLFCIYKVGFTPTPLPTF